MEHSAQGSFVTRDGIRWYRIKNMRDMPAFFINLATASDVWVFLSSRGALTAGRQDADGAVLPYETDDRLHLSAHTGGKTLVRLADGRVWEPFSHGYQSPYDVRRSLYKSLTGDAVMFKEINRTFGLTFACRWETSEKYGLVRTVCLSGHGDSALSFAVLDGVQNVLPYGITQGLADSQSCLTDSYKVCQRHGCVAVYSLTSTIVDSPEPKEVLRANAVWRVASDVSGSGPNALGHDPRWHTLSSAHLIHLLSSEQIDAFAMGKHLDDEADCQGRKGAYLTVQPLTLAPGERAEWVLCLDARLDQPQLSRLIHYANQTPPDALLEDIRADIQKGRDELTRMVAAADGLQATADPKADTRHYMNVLYNNMRGGVFAEGYAFDPRLFRQFAHVRSPRLTLRRSDFFDNAPANILDLHKQALQDGDLDIIRTCLSFLPLSFSRRHGDPSRPWNKFNIKTKDDAGHRLYHYEGNWRDIFQNWEAVAQSFPAYLAPMVAVFVNASTADGFNPYRVTHHGIDWEKPQPDNPFSGFGYWGDHQIVYLNRLLDWLRAYRPQTLELLCRHDLFTYADIPYEIKPYAGLLADGKDTITFVKQKHDRLLKAAQAHGTDAFLLDNRVSFIEKLLVPILAKLSNLIPGGGIWMNTQRPEWNDANNAIVGNGLSMVTVYQLYRHLALCADICEAAQKAGPTVHVSVEVCDWLAAVSQALTDRAALTPRAFLDVVAGAFCDYRALLYRHGLAKGKKALQTRQIADFFGLARQTLGETIEANRRADGLYHGYNIVTFDPACAGGLTVSPLFLMLEAQTAVLASGRLTPDEALALTAAMRQSGLYCDRHRTFYLYPKKTLKSFMARNIIPPERAEGVASLAQFTHTDADGNTRFLDGFRQARDLEAALDKAQASQADRGAILALYEAVFAHRQFVGRSGIMYKYEGIGSIYWHQNSKFILSFQEIVSRAAHTTANLQPLTDTYYTLRDGLGFNKPPGLWGAFPLEPYSHTPYGMPAQQPGMTGQVKEDILTRNAELGLAVADGRLRFDPSLLKKSAFLTRPSAFEYVDLHGHPQSLALQAGMLAFTVCQAPVVYTLADADRVRVYKREAGAVSVKEVKGLALDEADSRLLFERAGVVERIEVFLGVRG